MSVEAVAAPGGGPYLRYDVQYPERSSRLLNFFLFIKFLLAIPHFLILYALSAVAAVIGFIAWFAILFTGKYPRGLFDFVVGINRWNANVGAYLTMLRDDYPPFSWDPGKYPVTYELDYPDRLSRLLIFFKWLLVIPNLIVYLFVALAAYVVWIIAWFAILITGRFPRGMFNFIVGANRWSQRIGAYVSLLRDDYPPFSTK